MFSKPALSGHNGDLDAVRIAALVMANPGEFDQKKGGNGGCTFLKSWIYKAYAEKENCLSNMSTGVPLVVH